MVGNTRGAGALWFSMALACACTGTIVDEGSFVDEDPVEVVEREDLAPGMPAQTLGGAAAMTPEAGVGVHATILFEDGTSDELVLESDALGRVTEWVRLRPEPIALAGSIGACKDGAFNTMPFRWAQRLEWSFNAGSTPSYLTRASVESALKRATTNITRSRNDCGLGDRVSARQLYLGRKARGVNITRAGACGSPDGVNMVGFGPLPSGVLGVACTWYGVGTMEASEGDVRLNKASRWYTSKPAVCSNRFSVEAVATHERGHTFGLGHVDESRHGNLTMSTHASSCSNREATLGLGDVRALRRLY